MPIHYRITYNGSTGPTHCLDRASVKMDMVQDAIVKHDGSYVDQLEIVYSKAAGAYPTGSFTLELEDDGLAWTELPIESDLVESGSSGTASPFRISHTTSSSPGKHVVTIQPPAGLEDDVTTVFYFGSDSGPPTKLQVKVKSKPAFSCP